jgi:hypothetical protein
VSQLDEISETCSRKFYAQRLTKGMREYAVKKLC